MPCLKKEWGLRTLFSFCWLPALLSIRWERGSGQQVPLLSPATLVSAYYRLCSLHPTTALTFHRGPPGAPSSYHGPQRADRWPPKPALARVAVAGPWVVAVPPPALCPGEAKGNLLCLPSRWDSRAVEAVRPDYTSTKRLVKLLLSFKYIFRDCSVHVVFNFYTWLFTVIEVHN